MNLFDKILIANRGEIAVRIIRSAQKLGIKTVAIYSPPDAGSLHMKMADEAYPLKSVDLADSYLNIAKIIEIAQISQSEAIHPGYGFLAENSTFVKECENAGITFIGPNSDIIRLMGNKIEARQFIDSLGIPITKGVTGSLKELMNKGSELDYPVLIKAAAGGGGKGMRIINRKEELQSALESTSREALSYFGDKTIYIEKYIENPRHIEVQIIGDNFGNVVHLFERECSVQRRYQKIIEESPAEIITDELRTEITKAAVEIGKATKYNNAGTIEFMVDKNFNYYFLEMNTRIQVEHPVTELVTNTDLVEEQILIAAGNKLRFKQNEIKQKGYAIECRIYAEDPENNFRPSPGKIISYREPIGDGVRVDSGIDKPAIVDSIFDPIISKLIVYGSNRETARIKMTEALKEYSILGIKTNIPYLLKILENHEYISNNISTNYCEETLDKVVGSIQASVENIPAHIPLILFLLYSLNKNIHSPKNIWESIGYWRDVMNIEIELNDIAHKIKIIIVDKGEYKIFISTEFYQAKITSIENNKISLSINNRDHTAFASCDNRGSGWLNFEGYQFRLSRKDILSEEGVFVSDHSVSGNSKGIITSPMPGKIVKVNCKKGKKIAKGDVLLIVESMKMENNLHAENAGIVDEVNVKVGDMIDSEKILAKIKIEQKEN